MSRPPAPNEKPLLAEVLVRGRAYVWTAQDGLDPEAVMAIQHWIARLARPWLGRARALRLNLEDLVQAGTVGALKAARTFDPGMGRTYASWATRRIQDEIKALCRHAPRPTEDADQVPDAPERHHALEAGQIIGKLGRHDRNLLSRYFGLKNGRPATLAALARQMRLSPGRVGQKVNQALSRARRKINKRQ